MNIHNDRTSHRAGEEIYDGTQSDRFHLIKGQWFFQTREHVMKGPYGTLECSERALKSYIDMRSLESEVDFRH